MELFSGGFLGGCNLGTESKLKKSCLHFLPSQWRETSGLSVCDRLAVSPGEAVHLMDRKAGWKRTQKVHFNTAHYRADFQPFRLSMAGVEGQHSHMTAPKKNY